MPLYKATYLTKNTQADGQLSRCLQLAIRTNCPEIYVTGTHTSKGLELPVMVLHFGAVEYTVRDNFHDVNVMVKASKPVTLPLRFFYGANSFNWYNTVIAKKRGYSFRDWSDAEVEDPRILRVKMKNGNWSEVRGDEKDRWARRQTSTDWYVRDWSSGLLLTEGANPFDETTVFYEAPTPFAEGMKCGSLKPYAGPSAEFINCIPDWEELERIINGINENLNP